MYVYVCMCVCVCVDFSFQLMCISTLQNQKTADSDQAMIRVHSAVSLNGLAEAQLSDEDEGEGTLFKMDDHEHVD